MRSAQSSEAEPNEESNIRSMALVPRFHERYGDSESAWFGQMRCSRLRALLLHPIFSSETSYQRWPDCMPRSSVQAPARQSPGPPAQGMLTDPLPSAGSASNGAP